MWAQLASAVVGIWLMAAPAVLGYAGRAASADRIAGPLIVSFALIAAWEATRALRWLNVGLAAWLVAASLLLGYEGLPAINSALSGVLLGALSLVRGRRRHRYGGGWRALRRARARAPASSS